MCGAALIFFKRFYTRFSVLEHAPKAIMLTCVYLACKVCSMPSSLPALGAVVYERRQKKSTH